MPDYGPLGDHYLADALYSFRGLKKLGERAMAQLTDEELMRAPDEESNSVAIIVKHLAGNMRSRWTDFLATDGEKPDRNRDSEFVAEGEPTRAELLERWERGWAQLFAALEPLRGEDLLRTVMIRGEPHSVLQAINRQLTHYASHVGQIVFLAKHWKSKDWKSLSVPRGQSAAFNQKRRERQKP
jgi:hypothetical protein